MEMDAIKDTLGSEVVTVFKDLEQSYYSRCQDQVSAKAACEKLLIEYPPDRLTEFTKRAPLALAAESGDLGLALFWNAQATLIQPLLAKLLTTETNSATLSLLLNVKKSSAGALAVSESKTHPLIVTSGEGGLLLDGDKRYITGGAGADFLFLTGRSPAESTFSSMVFLPTSHIPADAMQKIDLGCFYTTNQAELHLSRFQVRSENLLLTETAILRRHLKVWGIIERSIIMEAILGLLLYLDERVYLLTGTGFPQINRIAAALEELTCEIDAQVDDAVSGDFVKPVRPVYKMLANAMFGFKSIYKANKSELPPDIIYRFKDLFYFLNFLIKKP